MAKLATVYGHLHSPLDLLLVEVYELANIYWGFATYCIPHIPRL
jgi:hypothetical protein